MQSKYQSMDITKNLEHYKFTPNNQKFQKLKSLTNYSKNEKSFSESKNYNTLRQNLYNKNSKIPPIYFYRKIHTPYKYSITSVPEYLIKTNEEKRFIEKLYKSINNDKEKNILENLIHKQKLNSRKDYYKPKNLDAHNVLRYKPNLYPNDFVPEKNPNLFHIYKNENKENDKDNIVLNTCPNFDINNDINISSYNNKSLKDSLKDGKNKKNIKNLKLQEMPNISNINISKEKEIKYKYKLSDIFNLYGDKIFTNKSAEKYLFKHENEKNLNKNIKNDFYTLSESKSDWIPNKINYKKMGTNSSVDYNIITPMFKGSNKFITATELNKNNNYNECPNFRKIKSISEFIDLTRVSATNTLPCFDRKNQIPNFKFKNLVATNQADEYYINKDLIDKAI